MKSAIDFLRWDSRFFGRRIARLKSPRLTSSVTRQALQECAKRRIECLYGLVSSQDPVSTACAEAHGFSLVDIRITFRKDLGSSEPMGGASDPTRMTIRKARAADAPGLRRLAGTLFSNSRFAVDPHFSKNAHRRLFAEWIAKSVLGRFDDGVWVAAARGRLAGFISYRKTGTAGTIGLVGVHRAFRRRGVGRSLLYQAFEWFGAHRVRNVSVVTQARAVEAQRLYQDVGFRTSAVDLWYHKWL